MPRTKRALHAAIQPTWSPRRPKPDCRHAGGRSPQPRPLTWAAHRLRPAACWSLPPGFCPAAPEERRRPRGAYGATVPADGFGVSPPAIDVAAPREYARGVTGRRIYLLGDTRGADSSAESGRRYHVKGTNAARPRHELAATVCVGLPPAARFATDKEDGRMNTGTKVPAGLTGGVTGAAAAVAGRLMGKAPGPVAAWVD